MSTNAVFTGGPQALAVVLRAERRKRRLRQRDLADLLGVTQQTVARWEAGDPPQRRHHQAIASFVGVSGPEFLELLTTPLNTSTAQVVRLDLRRGQDAAPPVEDRSAPSELQDDFLSAVIARIRTGDPIRDTEASLLKAMAREVGLDFTV